MPQYCGLIQIQPVDGIVAVDGNITTNVNPILAGEGAANSNAWVGATNGKSGAEIKWAQVGYLWRRLETGEMRCNVYVEVQAGPDDDTDYFVKYFDPPAAGSHRYAAVLDEFTGTWTFFFDKKYLGDFQHDGWKDITARKTQFTGEIHGTGARVLGTDAVPCTFSQCEYEIAATDPKHPNIVLPDFNDDDAWRVLDEVQGGGVGSVIANPLTGNEFSTSREVDASLAQDLGAVDRQGRPQSDSSQVPVAVVPASLAEAATLHQAHSRLIKGVTGGTLGDFAIVLSGVDPERHCLLVAVEQKWFRNPAWIHRRLREELGEVPIRVVAGHVDEQNGGAGNLKVRPLEGGTQISSQEAGGKSTLGICAYRVQTGRLGFLTAGHTVGAEHDLLGQPDSANLAGMVAANFYSESIDVAFANVLSGIEAGVFKVWTSSDGFTVTHILSDDPEEGMDCSIQGAQSGSQAGKVSKFINMTVYKDKHPVNGVTLATYASANGDSGAPVVNFGTADKVLLMGIHNGRAQAEGKDYAYFTQSSTFRAVIELAKAPPSLATRTATEREERT